MSIIRLAATCAAVFLLHGVSRAEQPYRIKYLYYPEGTPGVTYVTSTHFRLVWGTTTNIAISYGDGVWCSNEAKAYLTILEKAWTNAVILLGFNAPHEAADPALRDGYKYLANFYCTRTGLQYHQDGAVMGSKDSFGWAMADVIDLKPDPNPGMVGVHEWYHACEMHTGEHGGFNNKGYMGAMWETVDDYMLEQYFYNTNLYPKGPETGWGGTSQFQTMCNLHLFHPHGRNHYSAWMIWNFLSENNDNVPQMGTNFAAKIWRETLPEEPHYFPTMERITGLTVEDILINYAKRMPTTDFKMQSLYWQSLVGRDQVFDMNVSRMTPELERVPARPTWWRVPLEMAPMAGSQNSVQLVPTGSGAGRVVTVNFRGLSNSLMNASWRACLVAVDTNGGWNETYGTPWASGTNSITLSAADDCVYLSVVAMAHPFWPTMFDETSQMFARHPARVQYPWEVEITGATPKETPLHEKYSLDGPGHRHPNGGGFVENTAYVAPTAYVGTNAVVAEHARVLDNARIEDYGLVRSYAVVSNNAVVSGHGRVFDKALIRDDAKVRDYSCVFGNTMVADHAKVLEHAAVSDRVTVSNSAMVKGSTEVHSGWANEPQLIGGTAIVDGDWSSPNSAMHGVHCGAAYWPGPYSISSNFIESLRDIGTLTADYEFNRQHDSLVEDNWGLTHGYIEGSPAWVRTDGVRSGFLALNGSNQYLTLRNSVCDCEDMTLMLWVKWDGGAADQRLFHHGSSASKYMYLTPASSAYATGLVFAINDGSGEKVLKTSTLSSGVWKHIVVTLSNDTGRLYVDGTLVDTVTNITADPEDLFESNRNTTSNAVFVGRGPAGNYLAGAIDGVRVYRSALSAAEIGDIKLHCYSCVRYGFNETNGTTVADAYGAYNATVSDSSGWTNVAGRGRVLYLNGTSRFVSLPDKIVDQRNLTVACWVKFQSGSTIFDFGNSASWYMALKPNTAGKLNWNTYGGLGYGCIYDTQNVYGNASTAVDNDRWVHVAYTIDGNNNTVKLYRDGVCVGTNRAANAWESVLLPRPDDFAPTNCYVGRSQSGGYSRMFIDDLIIYERALTADEIASVMTSTAESPLVINTGITNATLGAVDACGSVLSTGSAAATVYVYWGKTDGGDVFATWTSNRLVTSAATVGSVAGRLQGLEAGKLYYFRFYATNSIGGNWATPSIAFKAPQGCEVSNDPGASNVVFHSATMNGTLTATYASTNHVYVYWGAADGGTNVTTWPGKISMGIRSTGVFTTNVAGLLSGTKYYYRTFASNVYGGWWANATTTFTTRIAALVDNDGGATNITAVSATLRGALGGVPGTTASYEAENAALYLCQVLTDSFASGGAKVGSFTYYADYILFTNVPGTMGVTIHYATPASRQCSLYVGTSDVATAYFPATPGWSDYSVVTLYVPVNGDVKLQIDGDDRTANGFNETGIDIDRITVGVAATPVYVFWGTNDGGTVKSAWSNVVSVGSVSPGPFSAAITSLGPATVHYYRCYASNSLGETWAAVSTNFITLAPIIVNNANGESGVTTNTVTLNGMLEYSLLSQSYVYIHWGTADGGTNKGAWTNSIALGSRSTGMFSSTLSGLVPGQSYYYRCYASNATAAAWAASSEPFVVAKDFSAWRHTMKIRFPGYDRAEPLTNFPALVVLHEGISNFFYSQCAAPDGSDLRFGNANNVELNYEIDEWNPGGTSYVWVQVPLLVGTDTYIRAYWGNAAATNFPAFTTNGTTWSEGYAALWHMSETNALDSLNLNHGTSQGATNAAGMIGICQGMPGGADRSVLINAVKSNLDITGTVTISGWVYYNSTAMAGILTKGTVWGNYNLHAKGGAGNYASLELKPFCKDSSSSPIGTTSMVSGKWYYVCGTWNGTQAKVYVNGREEASRTTNGVINNTSHQLKLGTLNDRYLCGSLDEVTVAKVARSSNWVWACWMNQGSNAAFSSYVALSNTVVATAAPANVEKFEARRGAQYGQISLSWSNDTVTVLACTNRFYMSHASYWFVLTNNVVSPWTHAAATNFPSIYYRIVSGPYTSVYDVGKFDVDIAPGSIAWLSFPFVPQEGCNVLSEWFGRQLQARNYSSYSYPLLQRQNGIGGPVITRSYYIDGTTNWFSDDDPIVQNAGYVLFLAQDHPAVKLTSLGMVPTNGIVLNVPYQTIPWIGLSYPSSVDMRDSGITNLFEPPQNYSLFDYDFVDSQEILGGPVWYAEYFIDDWGTGDTNFFTSVTGADRINAGKGYLLFFSTTRTQTGMWNYVKQY